TVAHVKVIGLCSQQALADAGGQALSQRDGVALAVFQPFDADLAVFVGNGGFALPGEGQVRREIGNCPRKILGKLKTSTRTGGFIVYLVVEHAKSVFLTQIAVDGLNRWRRRGIEAGAVGVQTVPPSFALGVNLAD